MVLTTQWHMQVWLDNRCRTSRCDCFGGGATKDYEMKRGRRLVLMQNCHLSCWMLNRMTRRVREIFVGILYLENDPHHHHFNWNYQHYLHQTPSHTEGGTAPSSSRSFLEIFLDFRQLADFSYSLTVFFLRQRGMLYGIDLNYNNLFCDVIVAFFLELLHIASLLTLSHS